MLRGQGAAYTSADRVAGSRGPGIPIVCILSTSPVKK
jgi:hypothetical protein